jgi:hypothetical protein
MLVVSWFRTDMEMQLVWSMVMTVRPKSVRLDSAPGWSSKQTVRVW